jgi:hypothetical protein
MEVTIGRCTASEIDDVVAFINEQWKPGHILATFRPLLDWQHRDRDGRGYAFVVARRRSDSAVLGILGYIATKRFDDALADANVLWLTTWRVRDDAGSSGLGIQLLQHLTSIEPHVAIGALGLTPSTLPIYRAFGYTVGELQHYVRPNANTATFKLASIRHRTLPHRDDHAFGVRRLVRDEDFQRTAWVEKFDSVPAKTPEYFRQRYSRHPVYRYAIAALDDAGSTVGLLAARVAEHDGCRALRIVDFAGRSEIFAGIGPAVQELLADFDAEYADVYNAGIAEEIVARAGFARIDPDSADIVPNHFEPFERRNVRLWFAIKGGNAIVFKGDADQDRPNQMPGVDA